MQVGKYDILEIISYHGSILKQTLMRAHIGIPIKLEMFLNFECIAATEKNYLDLTSIAIRLISVQEVSSFTYMQ